MQYEYSSTDKKIFSLHDCRALSASFLNDSLHFCFPEGIFHQKEEKNWPRTKEAEVEFVIDPMREVTVYLFTETEGRTIRRECALEELIEKINRHEWELEFSYRFDGYEEILFQCWVWEEKEPWSIECELWIGTKEKAIFRWNE